MDPKLIMNDVQSVLAILSQLAAAGAMLLDHIDEPEVATILEPLMLGIGPAQHTLRQYGQRLYREIHR